MRSAVEISVWWLLCVAVWLASLTSLSVDDVVLGVACALPCAFGAVGARALVESSWQPRLAWMRWYVKVPWAVLLQTVRLLWRAFSGRGIAGVFQTVQLPEAEAEDVSTARQGLLGLALSASPGAYIVDIDPDTRQTLIHTVPGVSSRTADIDLERP